MKDGVIWSFWYAILAILPLVMTRLLITNVSERAVARRQSSSVRQR